MILETNRLILRPFVKEDASDVFEYLKEPLVNCFSCLKLIKIEEAYKLLEKRSKDTEYTFAIVLKENNDEIELHEEHHHEHIEDCYMSTLYVHIIVICNCGIQG